jgi:hypothetical protein
MWLWIKPQDSNIIIIQTKTQKRDFLSDGGAQLRDS